MSGRQRPIHRFIGTYPCICGKRVRVYEWLPEAVLCAKCKADVARQERLSQSPLSDEEMEGKYDQGN